MKMVPKTIYKIVNDDGTEVRPATAQKIKDIVQIMKDAKVLGKSSLVATTVGMRIASAILSNYELRRKLPKNLPVVPEEAVISEPPIVEEVEEVTGEEELIIMENNSKVLNVEEVPEVPCVLPCREDHHHRT